MKMRSRSSDMWPFRGFHQPMQYRLMQRMQRRAKSRPPQPDWLCGSVGCAVVQQAGRLKMWLVSCLFWMTLRWRLGCNWFRNWCCCFFQYDCAIKRIAWFEFLSPEDWVLLQLQHGKTTRLTIHHTVKICRREWNQMLLRIGTRRDWHVQSWTITLYTIIQYISIHTYTLY